jgi:exosortase K
VTANVCAVAVAVLLALALKQHYAAARVDDLWWMLAPTTKLVSAITGVPFTVQPGEGYFSRERLFLIEKSCAGINFMIAAFAMLVLTVLHRVDSGGAALRVLAMSVMASYTAAVATNTLRIAIAMGLAAHPAPLTALSAAGAHRIEGIVVYFGGLVLLYELARRLERRAYPLHSATGAKARVEAAS